MSFFIRGALVEYGSDFLGPIPNIVVFQFNPEQISRTIHIPGSQSGAENPETTRLVSPHATSAPATESFSITAHFSAMDDLGEGAAIPRTFGIGPQLAALEKMANTSAGNLSQLIGAAIDAVGDALGLGGDDDSTRKIPQETAPRILFIWGPSRVLPVKIKTLSMTEQQYDSLLNPVQAQVDIGLEIVSYGKKANDPIGQGALTYTNTVKEAQALLNLAKAVELAVDTVIF